MSDVIAFRKTLLLWLGLLLAICFLVACQEADTGDSQNPTLVAGTDSQTVQPTTVLPPTITIPAESPTELIETGNDLVCREDTECVLALRIDNCCSCPELMKRSLVIADDTLVQYEAGQSYGELLPDSCANVDCEACQTPAVPVCAEDGRCRAQQSAETILLDCPDCFEQAAVAAFKIGDIQQAIDFCYKADTDTCLLALFDIATSTGEIEAGLQLCFDPAHPDPGGCLAALAPSMAAENSDRAAALCQQIATADVRHFGCLLDVAIIVHTINPEDGREICQLLTGERVGQCLEELGS